MKNYIRLFAFTLLLAPAYSQAKLVAQGSCQFRNTGLTAQVRVHDSANPYQFQMKIQLSNGKSSSFLASPDGGYDYSTGEQVTAYTHLNTAHTEAITFEKRWNPRTGATFRWLHLASMSLMGDRVERDFFCR